MRISFINNNATIVVVGAGSDPVTSVPTIFKGDKGDPGEASGGGTVVWDDVQNKPTEFTPAVHSHTIADITLLQATLDGKASSTHTHTWAQVTEKPTSFTPTEHNHIISEVTGLQTALDGKQPTTTFKTVNGKAITGTGNVVTSISFATDSEAIAYSNANPGVTVGSRQV